MQSGQIGITLGDPAGIGPEITAKAIAGLPPADRRRIVVIGDPACFRKAAALVGLQVPVTDLDGPDAAVRVAQIPDAAAVPAGVVSAEGGDAAFQAVRLGVGLFDRGRIGCLVTAPLNKAALHRAGHRFDGHTELLAHLTGRDAAYMLLASDRLNTVHISTHISLEEATRRPSTARVLAVIDAAIDHFKTMGVTNPRVAVAGLNPHCGEGGLFGRQEIETIGPAVEEAVRRGWAVRGPIPGDTVFYRASRGEFDVVVAQYHDQGHIPVKLIAFHTAVNVTLGLPLKRVSVDHGTAFDIAWTGSADATNMASAIGYAVRMMDAAG